LRPTADHAAANPDHPDPERNGHYTCHAQGFVWYLPGQFGQDFNRPGATA
jgi:hypothetical protein